MIQIVEKIDDAFYLLAANYDIKYPPSNNKLSNSTA